MSLFFEVIIILFALRFEEFLCLIRIKFAGLSKNAVKINRNIFL